MICGSVCSGIGAPETAWSPLGWRFAFASEIEPFPRAVLQHRHSGIPLHGDFTTIQAGDYDPIELLVGGTPCQSFSLAGLRGGLDDSRGNLALEFLRLADRLRPKWLVWENVPGVLSSNGGRDFGSILGGLVELRYGFAYRVLDAQYFGVPQRRRRVFVVGYLGDWRPPAAVLFERHSLQGHHPPRREAGQSLAKTLTGGSGKRGWSGDNGTGQGCQLVAPTLSARPTGGGGLGTDFDLDGGLISGAISTKWAKGTGGPSGDECQNLVAVAFSCKDYGADADAIAPTLRAMGHDGSHANAGGQVAAFNGTSVRRLTPRECERLQGFPDDYTLIPWRRSLAADGPRYKALGNSMAVPVMRWIGQRIQTVEAARTLVSSMEAA